jgi:membrane protein implicated in regulation of membrane protease activity
MTPTTATPATAPANRAATIRRWPILTAVLALGYLYIAVASPLPSIRWPTLAGALLVLAALALAARTRPVALAALVVGAILPAALAWWSLVLPATALLILLCGTLAIRETPRGGRRPRVPTGDLGPTGALGPDNTDGRH